MVIIPTPARSHSNFVDVPSLAGTRIRDVLDEPHPDDDGDCLFLGELDIVFRTGNDGPPSVGIVLTDPRGRRIGFDPLIDQSDCRCGLRHCELGLPECGGRTGVAGESSSARVNVRRTGVRFGSGFSQLDVDVE